MVRGDEERISGALASRLYPHAVRQLVYTGAIEGKLAAVIKLQCDITSGQPGDPIVDDKLGYRSGDRFDRRRRRWSLGRGRERVSAVVSLDWVRCEC